MRMSTNWGIKLSGMLTAILFAWPQVGCSPSQVGEGPPSTPQISDDESLAARDELGRTARHDLPAGVPAKVATVLRHIDTSRKAPPSASRNSRSPLHLGQARISLSSGARAMRRVYHRCPLSLEVEKLRS